MNVNPQNISTFRCTEPVDCCILVQGPFNQSRRMRFAVGSNSVMAIGKDVNGTSTAILAKDSMKHINHTFLCLFDAPTISMEETRAATRIPLRWEERNGYQWWFATPLDWAASNGFVEVAIELLKLDASLMKDLASLARIRRLEDLWDDECRFTDAAKGRGLIARELILHECHVNSHSVIEAGYGPWALYTAAAAGDMEIVQRLLRRKPQLVFGDREFGLTDMLYAAARANSSEIFREILCCVNDDYHSQSFRSNNNHIEYCRGMGIDVPLEVMNKALHAASRGGSVEIFRELVKQSNLHSHHRLNVVILCKDSRGGTALHSAASRGHLEVVKELLSASPGAITSQDDNGNTALHVAAYNGHWGVVKELLRRLPPLFPTINNDGNTILHLAVGGLRASGFRSPDRHMKVIRNFVSDKTLNLQSIINCKNREGRTALHIAVISGKRTDEKLVKLLVSAPGLDINIYDKNGMTAYDMVMATVASGLTLHSLLKGQAEAGGRPMIPQSPATSQLLRRASEDTEIIRLWEQSEDEIWIERREIVEEYSSKTSEFANSKNNPRNQMNYYPAKQRRGTLSELFHGLKIKARRSHTEDAGMRNSKENRVKAYVEEVSGFSQTGQHSRPSSPLIEQYFSASSVAGDDYYSVFSLSPSPSISFPSPSSIGSPPFSGTSKVKAKGWLHMNSNGNGAQAVFDSKPVMSLRNYYLSYGSVPNFERQKATSRPPLPSRRAG